MNAPRVVIRFFIVAGIAAIMYAFLRLPTALDQFSTQKSINVLAWPNVMDAEYFADFEKETGIRVYLSYFENYEELLVKMRAGSGDYDLIMASDYAVNILLEEGIVKPLDKSKLLFFKDLYPSLLNLYYDKENQYTIPFAWEVYGIGIDTNHFKEKIPAASWDLLFDPKVSPSRIGMLDDAKEIVSVAALYLFGKKKKSIDESDLEKIQKLLVQQKQRVVMYTDLRTDYLLVSNSAPVVMGISSDIYNAMRKYKNIKFLLPKEGSFVVLDTFMMPISTEKEDLVYDFLNYLYQPEIIKKYADRYNFFPALKGVASDKDRYLLSPTKSLFSRLRFFSYDIPEHFLRELWIALKS